jgi:L-amino acid N-acyltransferase YncA
MISGVPGVRRQALLANIAPANVASQKLFEELGFKHVQNTYAFDVT